MQNSTDDDASDPQPSKRFEPRYDFQYPSLTPDNVPIFSTKVFWDCFNSSVARAFAKLICRIHHLRYTSGSDQEHQSLLEQALPEFHLALSHVDATKELPKDVTLALAGLNRVLITLTDFPDEYSHLVLPDLDAGPYFAATARPPTSQKQPTDAELRNAPHFYHQLSNPVKKGKAPVKASKKQAHNSTDEEEVRALSNDEIPATTPAKKSSSKVVPPAQKKAKLDPVASTSKPIPVKGPITSLLQLPPVNHSKDLDPSDDQTASGTKRCTGRVTKKQEKAKPKERDHKAAEATVNALTTQLCEAAITSIEGHDNFTLLPFNNQSLIFTLSYLQEHRSYNPCTALGPGSNYSKSKEDEKFTPIRSVPILAADQTDLENAIRPEWPCGLCSLFRVICKPMGVGMACTNCNVKKLNSLCDHQISGARINRLYHDLAESAKAFGPSLEIDVPHLIKSGSAAADTSSLVFHLREDFIEGFRHYLEAISEHHLWLGTESFNEAFAPSVSMDARELLQDLIAEYNYLMDPAPRVEGSMSPHESRKGSTVASSPPADDNGNKGKGEGSSKSQGGVGGRIHTIHTISWSELETRPHPTLILLRTEWPLTSNYSQGNREVVPHGMPLLALVQSGMPEFFLLEYQYLGCEFVNTGVLCPSLYILSIGGRFWSTPGCLLTVPLCTMLKKRHKRFINFPNLANSRSKRTTRDAKTLNRGKMPAVRRNRGAVLSTCSVTEAVAKRSPATQKGRTAAVPGAAKQLKY
ncbi:hypothetical protein DFH08DRAFT_814823 [Mycena albidolilacea]|uniref:Uncharacterized protein n=1 Tax=Mycena albidolilacea TaxID=1033008 RepID=A0AAD6ZNY3_9AGAR|nr:hypothetical protein DFH08DRAFT_814823 [Mycena albidolilacea]